MKIEETVHQLFVEEGWTLSTAESCTGGSIAARLTKLSGASKYFLGALVCYSNDLKYSLLGVKKTTLQSYGAVSQQAVEEMATGLIKITQSDFGLAISGIAGPTGSAPEKPVGTIWAALIKKGERPLSWKFQVHGSRENIIEQSVDTVLDELVRFCHKQKL